MDDGNTNEAVGIPCLEAVVGNIAAEASLGCAAQLNRVRQDELREAQFALN